MRGTWHGRFFMAGRLTGWSMNIQRGFSLIEVLVALLLVSMVFLGFLAVQMKAYHSSRDAAIRTQAVSAMTMQAEILQGTNEQTRQEHERFFQKLNQNSAGVSHQLMSDYQRALGLVSVDCVSRACSEVELVRYQAYQAAKVAAHHGIRLNVAVCGNHHCLLAAWGDTIAGVGVDGCVDTSGVIQQGAKCMTMRVY